MRFIFIILFLISFGSDSMGGVGDVYYCVQEINKRFDPEETNYEKLKFTLKIDIKK